MRRWPRWWGSAGYETATMHSDSGFFNQGNLVVGMSKSRFGALATVVSAAPGLETNAQRMARGLPPLPPARRATGTEAAKRGTPSGGPGQCGSGPVQCCNSVGKAQDGPIGLLLGLLGIIIHDIELLIGVTCSPITIIGSGNGCNSGHKVCCENNSYNGLVALGCVPVT